MRMRKAYMLFVILLWTVAGVMLLLRLNREDEEAVAATFGSIDCRSMQSCFSAEGVLNEGYLTGDEQKALLEKMAERIGITGSYDIVSDGGQDRRTITLEKYSNAADVIMKIYTYEDDSSRNQPDTRQYFSMKLTLYEYVTEIVVLKNEIEKVIADSPFECQYGMEFEAMFDGELSTKEKSRLSHWLLGEINAKTVSEIKNEQLYTIYAYTDYIREYELVDGNAVNVNLAFSFDEIMGKTKFYMATPYLLEEY